DELEADLRRRLMLIYHPVGTARMSDTEPEAVVDSQLRVHGLEGLRVVDASIMPLIPRGNTNAATMMIAERGADLIRGRVSVPASAPAPAGRRRRSRARRRRLTLSLSAHLGRGRNRHRVERRRA